MNTSSKTTSIAIVKKVMETGIRRALDLLNGKVELADGTVAGTESVEAVKEVFSYICKPMEGTIISPYTKDIFDSMFLEGICTTGKEKIQFWADAMADTRLNKIFWNIGNQLIWVVEENLHMADLTIEKMSEEEMANFVSSLNEQGDKKNFYLLVMGLGINPETMEKFIAPMPKLVEVANSVAYLYDNENLGYDEESFDWGIEDNQEYEDDNWN